MKTLLLALSLSCCTYSWASQSTTCQMHSGGNQSEVILSIGSDAVEVSMAGELLEACVLDSSSSYTLLVRCGEGEDATYFGVKGKSGKVYADFGKIADLKNCR